MIAGSNCRVDIYSIENDEDDLVGGAVVTGTMMYQNVLARFQSDREDQLILQQGLETVRTFTFTVFPASMHIEERDEIEVIKPLDHTYYGDRFRIVSVRYADFNQRDPRNYVILHTTRNVKAHARQ